jgi:hypothetical protein
MHPHVRPEKERESARHHVTSDFQLENPEFAASRGTVQMFRKEGPHMRPLEFVFVDDHARRLRPCRVQREEPMHGRFDPVRLLCHAQPERKGVAF